VEAHWPAFGLSLDGAHLLSEAFVRRRPIVVEIGFGSGENLLAAASEDRGRNFVGIEVYESGLGRVLGEAARLGLSNLKVAAGDAVTLLERVPPGRLSEVWLFFPDPWPKKRQKKRRLVTPKFVRSVRETLRPGGRFLLSTDCEDYAHRMTEVLEWDRGLRKIARAGEFASRPAARRSSRYERRARARGHVIHDLVYERRRSLPADAPSSALPDRGSDRESGRVSPADVP